MPSWLPGDDYMTNFKVGDPYVRVDDGYARLPGAGYEALHPELKGVNPEDYPDINKLSILADVAPYSREYNLYRQKVASEARNNTELEIELAKIVDRVRQTKESSITTDNRRFTAPVEEIEGTVDSASDQVSPSCRNQRTSRAGARDQPQGFTHAQCPREPHGTHGTRDCISPMGFFINHRNAPDLSPACGEAGVSEEL
jgi:hypothetical protein